MDHADRLRGEADRVQQSVGTLLAVIETGESPSQRLLRELEVDLKALAVHVIMLRKGGMPEEQSAGAEPVAV